METFSALLALCAGNSPVTGEFPAQRLVTRSFDGFFDLRLNKRLSKQWWRWWFETPSRPLWRHCNDMSWEYFTSVLLIVSLDDTVIAFNLLSVVFVVVVVLWNYKPRTRPRLQTCTHQESLICFHIAPLIWMFGVCKLPDKWGINLKTYRLRLRTLLRWMSQKICDDKLTLVHVMDRCCQSVSNYPSQCCTIYIYIFISPYGVTS